MRATSTVARGTRHIVGVGLQALLLAAIVATVALAMSAFYKPAGFVAGVDDVAAARGGKPALTAAGSSITIDAGSNLNLGGSVTFATASSGLTGNEYALVYLKCVQGDTVVYGQLDLPATTFVLGGGSSPWWQVGGTATCVAYLQAYGTHGGSDTIRTLAQTASFSAN